MHRAAWSMLCQAVPEEDHSQRGAAPPRVDLARGNLHHEVERRLAQDRHRLVARDAEAVAQCLERRPAGDAPSPTERNNSPAAASHTLRLSKLGWTDTDADKGSAPAAEKPDGGITVVARGWEHAMHANSVLQQRRARQGALVAADERGLDAGKTAPVATDAPKPAEHRRSSHWLTARTRVLRARVIANCKITQLHWGPDAAAPWAQFDGWQISMVRTPPPPRKLADGCTVGSLP